MWNSLVITIAAGTAVRFAAVPTLAKRLRICPLIGSSAGVIYVLNQNQKEVMSKATPPIAAFVDELAPASATVPGGKFAIDVGPNETPIDVADYGVDGSHTGDTVLVSWEIG